MGVTNDERRRVAAALRRLAGGYVTIGEVEEALGLSSPSRDVDLESNARDLHRLADLIEPDPRAEEIVAKAYRAAADQIDWELGDTPRVTALRKRAEELEAMARERDAAAEDPELAPKCSEATPKCDRKALLALAEGLDFKADRTISAAQHDAYEWRCIARRIREALGAAR